MDLFCQWVINSWVENLAVLTGIIYIILSVKQRVSCWFFGIASSILYFFVFFQSQIYADMLLQVYYVLVGIYGWIHWAGVDASMSMIFLPITRLSKSNKLYLLFFTCIMMVGIAQFLIYFTDSPVPWLDALTTSLSVTATWMLARKVLEHWIIWVIVDLIYIGLFYYRGLFPSILLFLVYTALAIVGYFEWIKQWKKNQSSPAIL
jgi:nicotinamide mononucleotide transporter